MGTEKSESSGFCYVNDIVLTILSLSSKRRIIFFLSVEKKLLHLHSVVKCLQDIGAGKGKYY